MPTREVFNFPRGPEKRRGGAKFSINIKIILLEVNDKNDRKIKMNTY